MPRLFVPMVELSWTVRSLGLSFPGTNEPWSFRSADHSFTGTFVPCETSVRFVRLQKKIKKTTCHSGVIEAVSDRIQTCCTVTAWPVAFALMCGSWIADSAILLHLQPQFDETRRQSQLSHCQRSSSPSEERRNNSMHYNSNSSPMESHIYISRRSLSVCN